MNIARASFLAYALTVLVAITICPWAMAEPGSDGVTKPNPKDQEVGQSLPEGVEADPRSQEIVLRAIKVLNNGLPTHVWDESKRLRIRHNLSAYRGETRMAEYVILRDWNPSGRSRFTITNIRQEGMAKVETGRRLEYNTSYFAALGIQAPAGTDLPDGPPTEIWRPRRELIVSDYTMGTDDVRDELAGKSADPMMASQVKSMFDQTLSLARSKNLVSTIPTGTRIEFVARRKTADPSHAPVMLFSVDLTPIKSTKPGIEFDTDIDVVKITMPGGELFYAGFDPRSGLPVQIGGTNQENGKSIEFVETTMRWDSVHGVFWFPSVKHTVLVDDNRTRRHEIVDAIMFGDEEQDGNPVKK